jgi:hypothetical protein
MDAISRPGVRAGFLTLRASGLTSKGLAGEKIALHFRSNLPLHSRCLLPHAVADSRLRRADARVRAACTARESRCNLVLQRREARNEV